MTQPTEWSARLVAVIAGEVRRHREAQGLSAQRVADACEAAGHPIPRSVLANLESGRREVVSVAELLVLAKVLRVPPVLLVFPLGHEDTIEILPGRKVDVFRALLWFAGEMPFTGDEKTVIDLDGWYKRGQLVQLYREHQQRAVDLMQARRSAGEALLSADSADDEADRTVLLNASRADGRVARIAESALRSLRSGIRQFGVTPPELPPSLAYLDEEEIRS